MSITTRAVCLGGNVKEYGLASRVTDSGKPWVFAMAALGWKNQTEK